MRVDDLLVLAMALPSVWLAAQLWWSTRHAVEELREPCAAAFCEGHGEGEGSDAAIVALTSHLRADLASGRI